MYKRRFCLLITLHALASSAIFVVAEFPRANPIAQLAYLTMLLAQAVLVGALAMLMDDLARWRWRFVFAGVGGIVLVACSTAYAMNLRDYLAGSFVLLTGGISGVFAKTLFWSSIGAGSALLVGRTLRRSVRIGIPEPGETAVTFQFSLRQIFVVTLLLAAGLGLFRLANSLDPSPVWELVLRGMTRITVWLWVIPALLIGTLLSAGFRPWLWIAAHLAAVALGYLPYLWYVTTQGEVALRHPFRQERVPYDYPLPFALEFVFTISVTLLVIRSTGRYLLPTRRAAHGAGGGEAASE